MTSRALSNTRTVAHIPRLGLKPGVVPACRRCSGTRSKQPSRKRRSLGISYKAAAAVHPLQAIAQVDEADCLSSFLGWLLANGVQGIGQEDSLIALYQAEGSERGLLACADLCAQQPLLTVPLRLALTDHPDDEESNALLYEGAPWSVRLAARLLREAAKGRSSPWWPYLQALPALVPAPLETFSWDDMQQIQYSTGQEAVYSYSWLVSDAYSHCSPEVLGGASRELFQWAMSLVHSRTFGSAAKEGGVGVRMLVPLIDMLNHAGDEAQLLLDSPATATDNVRWDLAAPAEGGGGWAMVLSTVRPVLEGEPLLLSYGERSNDDFFVHYGFVPRSNPHDDVVLFGDMQQALDWHWEQLGAQQGMSEEQALQLYQQAYEQAAAEQQQEVEARAGGPVSDLPQTLQQQMLQLKVTSGGRIAQSLMTALLAVSGGERRRAEAATALRSWQLLQSMGPLLQDLQLLHHSATDSELQGYYAAVIQHYDSAVCRMVERLGPAAAREVQASLQGSGLQTSGTQQGSPSSQLQLAAAYRTYKKMLLWDLLLRLQPTEAELSLS